MLESKLLVSAEVVVSDGFHGPERIGVAASVVLGEHIISGEFQGPWRMGTVGRATTDAVRKTMQYTSSILGMVTCSLKRSRRRKRKMRHK